MKFPVLQTATAVALVLGVTAAYAQGQPRPDEGKGSPPAAQGEAPKSNAPKQGKQGAAPEARDNAGKGNAQSEPKNKGAQQVEPKEKASKGAAQKEPTERPGKGTAQTQPQEKSKGSAQTEPKDKGPKGAEKGATPSPKSSESPKGEAPKDSTAKAPASGQRVQLSEQQRTSVHRTLQKERSVNRATNVNFTINVGTRIPREVRLQALPASVIAIVPQYRTYRYLVVDDRICIVEPSTYEIVEVITVSDRMADRGGGSRLVLSDDERAIVLREIEIRGGSTLGLGSLTEGADVPRGVELHSFPEALVVKVSKLRGYRYFTAENRIAIVDPQDTTVRLVIEDRR